MRCSKYMLVAALVAVLAAALATTASDGPSEYEVKAAFVYNFAKFVDWPDGVFRNDSSAVVVGVIGSTEMGRNLERTMAGKTIRGRRLVVKSNLSLSSVGSCHIVCVDSLAPDSIPSLVNLAVRHHVLTVGDIPQFAARGGVINFYTHQNKVRFEINPAAARQAGLSLSAQLLQLARIVETRTQNRETE